MDRLIRYAVIKGLHIDRQEKQQLLRSIRGLPPEQRDLILNHPRILEFGFVRDLLGHKFKDAAIFVKNVEDFEKQLRRIGLKDIDLLKTLPKGMVEVKSRPSNLQQKFRYLFEHALISTDLKIGTDDPSKLNIAFERFFSYMDEVFKEVSRRDILLNAKAARGMSFGTVANAIIKKKNVKMECHSHGTEQANAIRLYTNNFDLTWPFGAAGNQNFSFTIYFNPEDIEPLNGRRIVRNGYTQEYIRQMAAASPSMARKALQQAPLRLEGQLSWKKLKFIGFRFRTSGNEEFTYKFYKL